MPILEDIIANMREAAGYARDAACSADATELERSRTTLAALVGDCISLLHAAYSHATAALDELEPPGQPDWVACPLAPPQPTEPGQPDS